MAQIDSLLTRMTALAASGLHLKVAMRPRFRIHGLLEDVPDTVALDRQRLELLTDEILTDEQRQNLARTHELDFAYGNRELGRFRCNYFHDHWGRAAVFRRIPSRVPS